MTRKTIEDTRVALPSNKTERRTNKPASELQRFAAVENFALFLLRGIQTHIRNPRIADIISPAVADTIYLCADQEIRRIKQVQADRKDLK